jgi:SAM-dependent methyltransferase
LPFSTRGKGSLVKNIDPHTVEGFGREWQSFDQSTLSDDDARSMFGDYFSLFDFTDLGEGFDLGCGTGRWARLVAPRCRTLHCIDPSDAIDVARRNLANHPNVAFHRASADDIPLADGSQDFGYSLGVLHHIPDPEAALRNAVAKIRQGGQFLLYIYYRFDNRPLWFRLIWRASDLGRRVISNLPFPARKGIAALIAATVYWPLAKVARVVEKSGRDPSPIPLNWYRNLSFYTMRTDALDRFGTRLEHRFTKAEIQRMMQRCGLENIRFSDHAPYWVALGTSR